MLPGHLVPQRADGHERPLRDEDEGGGCRPPQHAAVHRPQPGQDPEQRGLAAPGHQLY